MHLLVVIAAVSLVLVLSQPPKDYVALQIPLINTDSINNVPEYFSLKYSELSLWKVKAAELARITGTDGHAFTSGVFSHLEAKQYPSLLLESDEYFNNGAFSSTDAAKILQTSLGQLEKGRTTLSLSNRNNNRRSQNVTVFKTQDNDIKQTSKPAYENIALASKLPTFLIQPQRIILYQSLGANTGGTTAMNILHDTLQELGYGVILCNDNNRYSEECRRPAGDQLVITGEWCHEVLEEYTHGPLLQSSAPSPLSEESSTTCSSMHGSSSSDHAEYKEKDAYAFLGRGLQYYLGFHHNDDSCRGRVAIADSHFISKLLGARQLGAYYLGCPMSRHIMQAYNQLVVAISGGVGSGGDGDGQRDVVRVIKENLVLVDPDFGRDYPPESVMSFELPDGWKMVYVQGIPPDQMPLLLQRAKIVLDLGMPGPERLSGEAIMFGAIPIISTRWNGASHVDFPGLHRVNHDNASEITATIEYVAENYENELRRAGNSEFLSYILGLDRQLRGTADTVFGSSKLHFILHARTLQEETVLTFQVLALLYVYPLCSIDVYVTDVVWFMRHHYLFYGILKSSGYIRIDPLNPTEFRHWKQPSGGHAFVNVKSLVQLKHGLSNTLLEAKQLSDHSTAETTTTTLANSPLNLTPIWNPLLVVLQPGVVFRNPNSLFELISDMHHADSVRHVCHHSTACDTNSESMTDINRPYLALLLAPQARLTVDVLTALQISLGGVSSDGTTPLVTADLSNETTSPSCDGVLSAADLTTAAVASVCGLYYIDALYSQQQNRSSNTTHDIVDSVVYSIPWMTLKSHTSELDFVC